VTDLAIARLRVQVAQDQLALARTLQERLTVRATAPGTVTSILTAEGAAVDATTPLMRVQDLDNLAVTVNLTEFDVSKTAVGATTRISADGLGGKAYAGEVADVALSGDNTGGVVTFPVIVAVTDPEGLRPAMSVSVRIIVAAATDVLRIPVDAIEDRDGRDATVIVRTRSGGTSDRSVRLGLVGASYAEVRSGLAAGDKVVVATDEE
jgi:membrane fusion protein (multidrug efflux system)